ncbi:MAG TPA: hypothetical protein DCM14_02960 [Clostridiales bacterium UBA8153]|nr:hypothetical protein [Clostridiales bacterium UBA8153]
MKKISVLVLKPLAWQVLEVLQRQGAVQLVRARTEDPDLGSGLAPVPVETGEIERELEKARLCLRHLTRFWRERKGFIANFIGARRGVSRAQLAQNAGQFSPDELFAGCSRAESRLDEIKQSRSGLTARRQALLAWQALDMPLEQLTDTPGCRVITGQLAVRELSRAQQLTQAVPVHLEVVHQDGRHAYVVVLARRDSADAEAAVRAMELTAVSLRELAGTPAQLLAGVDRQLQELEQEEAEIAARARQLLGEVPRLRMYADWVALAGQVRNRAADLGATAATVLLRGWCPERQVERIREALYAISPAVELVAEDPGPGDRVPVRLENPGWVQPFEVITGIYGYPKYGALDPTPLLAPFFLVFFGLALSDAGYGIVLTFLSVLAIRKLDLPRGSTRLLRLLAYAGVSTVVFGALTGGWFGDLFDFLPVPALRQARAALTVLDPLQQPMTMLLVSLALGLVQIWFGLFLKLRAFLARGAWADALWETGPWLFLLPSLVLMAAGPAGPWRQYAQNAALAGALWVMAGASRQQPKWYLKPFTGLWALYSITGYFADTLSYSRLLALGLATGVIASAINQIARLGADIPVVGAVAFVAIMLGGHAFNLIMNVLGSFIHSGRLQFVEFFSKFFEEGGGAFRPFREETEFVHVID